MRSADGAKASSPGRTASIGKPRSATDARPPATGVVAVRPSERCHTPGSTPLHGGSTARGERVAATRSRLFGRVKALKGMASGGRLPGDAGTRPPLVQNPVNPRVGSGMQQARRRPVARTVEVVRNHEGGAHPNPQAGSGRAGGNTRACGRHRNVRSTEGRSLDNPVEGARQSNGRAAAKSVSDRGAPTQAAGPPLGRGCRARPRAEGGWHRNAPGLPSWEWGRPTTPPPATRRGSITRSSDRPPARQLGQSSKACRRGHIRRAHRAARNPSRGIPDPDRL
jgi:hypothetical protein